ncbi:hypothetical protein [Saccharibacillus kuerlensis]|uniref:Uncharacterized protein n=1 Tax=Saccharibacillus kuerlensis TaxID=459527 RepID=A0ABQ2L5U4_9BACL|nr:hypothetical protein [Saccharibacillus kuerlensis]GGO04332.1 hypothetical protein GCM10010969_29440 [Saccharibacillus kuerlensis]
MNREQAVERLKKHAFLQEDTEDAEAQNGFLGMLRPFQGELIEENFREVMEILDVLAEELEQDKLDRTILSCLWGICQYGRAWAVEPDGMLRSSELISDEQLKQMAQWIDMLSYAVTMLLEGGGREEAFWTYKEYLNEQERIRKKNEF